MYDFLSGYQLPRDPGERFEYSNLGVGLLGHITLTPWMREHLAPGHDAAGAVVPNWDLLALAGAGAIRSTALDMLKFADANLHAERGTLQQAMAFAHRERASAGAPTMSIGLNWMSLHAGGDTIVWHNGGTGGYRTYLGFEPSQKPAVVVLTNTGGQGADDIGAHLLAPALPLAAAPVPMKQRTAVELAPNTLSRYVGTYQLAPAFVLEITLADGALYMHPTGQANLRIWPETDTDFLLKEVDAQVSFVRDTQGMVTGLVLHQNGQNLTAPKVK